MFRHDWHVCKHGCCFFIEMHIKILSTDDGNCFLRVYMCGALRRSVCLNGSITAKSITQMHLQGSESVGSKQLVGHCCQDFKEHRKLETGRQSDMTDMSSLSEADTFLLHVVFFCSVDNFLKAHACSHDQSMAE